MQDERSAAPPRRWMAEISGSLGDLGTFLPHVVGAITVAGLAPAGILLGFGVFLIGSGAFYGLPIPVQPMKAVSAVLLTEGLSAGEIAASGLMLGLVLLVLGASGLIGQLARLVPQSVSTGLQLGLGIAMAVLGCGLIVGNVALGLLTLLLLLSFQRLRGLPAVPLALLLVTALGLLLGEVAWPAGLALRLQLPHLVLPTLDDLLRAFQVAVLPQLALTVTNAVIVTAALARDLFGLRAARAGERNLALSTGVANLALCPFGALPMCHGAGGLQAHHRFGARSGLAPLLLGALLLALALGVEGIGLVLAMIPGGAVGALLVLAGLDLAASRRLLDARPSCWPTIGLTAALLLLTNPALALIAGCLLEAARRPLLRQTGRRID